MSAVRNRTVSIIQTLALALALLATFSLIRSAPLENDEVTPRGEAGMKTVQAAVGRSLPALDREAPSTIRTATFALG